MQEGCDKFCSFCVVPYTRGAEYSRPVKAILDEIRQLIKSGAREVTLLGQNVNAWHGQAPDGSVWNLARLIKDIADINGIERIRYTTSHPLDMDESLLLAHRDVPLLMPYLHLPVQSGSDKILQAMNRRHKADEYRRIIDKLRTYRPDIAISGDFIVGFPNESDRDFADTIRLVDDIGYASAYSFKYSPRPGTPAANDAAQIDEQIKSDRLAALQQLLDAQKLAFNKKFEMKTMPVLIEKKGTRDGQLTGRSPYMQSVYLDGDASQIGQILPLYITKAGQNSLTSTHQPQKGVA